MSRISDKWQYNEFEDLGLISYLRNAWIVSLKKIRIWMRRNTVIHVDEVWMKINEWYRVNEKNEEVLVRQFGKHEFPHSIIITLKQSNTHIFWYLFFVTFVKFAVNATTVNIKWEVRVVGWKHYIVNNHLHCAWYMIYLTV